MALILGIDPGSRRTGFGLVDVPGGRACYVTSGVIRVPDTSLAERLKVIFDSVTQLTGQYVPDQLAIEEVFMGKNASSALQLGQARGAAITAAAVAVIPVFEYATRTVKDRKSTRL